jgi:hypothetical protein
MAAVPRRFPAPRPRAIISSRWVASSPKRGFQPGPIPLARSRIQIGGSRPVELKDEPKDPMGLTKTELQRVERDLLDSLRGTCIAPNDPPRRAYHYTTVEGLFGILKTRTLWAIDVSYVNDTSEYVYADQLLRGVLASHKETEKFAERPSPLELPALTFSLARPYIASLCESKDLLSQWRYYSKCHFRGQGRVRH